MRPLADGAGSLEVGNPEPTTRDAGFGSRVEAEVFVVGIVEDVVVDTRVGTALFLVPPLEEDVCGAKPPPTTMLPGRSAPLGGLWTPDRTKSLPEGPRRFVVVAPDESFEDVEEASPAFDTGGANCV